MISDIIFTRKESERFAYKTDDLYHYDHEKFGEELIGYIKGCYDDYEDIIKYIKPCFENYNYENEWTVKQFLVEYLIGNDKMDMSFIPYVMTRDWTRSYVSSLKAQVIQNPWNGGEFNSNNLIDAMIEFNQEQK